MHKKSALLLGVGSPFGADRLGWLAVQALEPLLATCHPRLALSFEQCDRPGSRLLTLLGSTDAALIIDAMHSGATPGSVRRISVDELTTAGGLMNTHGFGVAEALALGRTLADRGVLRLPPQLAVFGIELDDTATPEHTLSLGLPALQQQVGAVLKEWGAG